TTSPEADGSPDWETAPAWSPDGKWIAYLHGGDPKLVEYVTHKLAVIPAAGGAPRMLTADRDRNVEGVRWSPDGQWLEFVLEEDRVSHLARVKASGGPIEVQVGGRRTVSEFDLGPAGKTAILASDTEHPAEIFAVETEGAL